MCVTVCCYYHDFGCYLQGITHTGRAGLMDSAHPAQPHPWSDSNHTSTICQSLSAENKKIQSV